MKSLKQNVIVLSLFCFLPAAGIVLLAPVYASDQEAGLPAGNNLAAINPDAPAELRQFDFMVGEFERKERLRNSDGSWGEWQEGEWNARYFMNGFGIIDESINYVTGVSTANIRIFDPVEHKWKVTWLKFPGYKSLSAEGSKIGDEIVLIPAGSEQKYVFSDIAADSYNWTLQVLMDGEYVPVLEILCSRKIEQ